MGETGIGIGATSAGSNCFLEGHSFIDRLWVGGFLSSEFADFKESVGYGWVCVGSPSTKWLEHTKVSLPGLKFLRPFFIIVTHWWRFSAFLLLLSLGTRCHFRVATWLFLMIFSGSLCLLVQPCIQHTLFPVITSILWLSLTSCNLHDVTVVLHSTDKNNALHYDASIMTSNCEDWGRNQSFYRF